jgi:mannose-6-phosphate isomerase-like protein (cupin superfamily)
MEKVIEQLKTISHEKIAPLLDAKHAVDTHVGIIIFKIEDIGPVVLQPGLKFYFHAARILPGETHFVKPHFHKKGDEPYLILSGAGEMNLGTIKEGKVVWDEPRKVMVGDIVEVREEQVHSLRNVEKTPLDFVVACPDEHKVDNTSENPEGDRYFPTGLADEIPPWYPKQN